MSDAAEPYDSALDARLSYEAAIEAKRARGDKHWPESKPWKRVERIGDCILYLGDCMAVMPRLEGIDAVVTDPPYGIGKDGQKQSSGAHGGRKAYDFKGWDKQRPPEELFAQLLGISKAQIIWGGNYFADLLPARGKWLVWDKGQRINQSDGELAYTSLDGALRVFDLNRVALMTDGAQHPTQKPVELMKWCLGFLPDARTILDPFMGSGTTLVACAKVGKRGVGIEIDPGYFDIACERIRKAYAQPDMFVARPPEPKQSPLFPEAAE